jgi:hypothetical protein
MHLPGWSFGFTGALHPNALVYLRVRWYDPSSGTAGSFLPSLPAAAALSYERSVTCKRFGCLVRCLFHMSRQY